MVVKELIKKLEALDNQNALIHVEAPLYNANSINGYVWPFDDFSIKIWGIEDQNNSDGETIILKSCIENENGTPFTPTELLVQAANSLSNWFKLVDNVKPRGIERNLYNSLIEQIQN